MDPRTTTIIGMIVFAALTRLLPHPPNLTSVAAVALFAGSQLPNRCTAFAVPLAALFLSDLVLGLHRGMLLVYASVGITVWIGMALRHRITPVRVAGAALLGSILFFVVTNFGVWLFGGLFPRTLAGLSACYVAAIPFFQNTAAGDLFFSAALFGGHDLLRRIFPELRHGQEAGA